MLWNQHSSTDGPLKSFCSRCTNLQGTLLNLASNNFTFCRLKTGWSLCFWLNRRNEFEQRWFTDVHISSADSLCCHLIPCKESVALVWVHSLKRPYVHHPLCLPCPCGPLRFTSSPSALVWKLLNNPTRSSLRKSETAAEETNTHT